jgi:hypothetical protein
MEEIIELDGGRILVVKNILSENGDTTLAEGLVVDASGHETHYVIAEIHKGAVTIEWWA